MKSVTVCLSDDVYEHIERRAANRGSSPGDEIAEILEQTVKEAKPGPEPDSGDLLKLFQALDQSRNVESVGPLHREELYDRVLH